MNRAFYPKIQEYKRQYCINMNEFEFWLPFIYDQFVQPLFKANQFFFEFSKLTSLIHMKNDDPNQKIIIELGALSKDDPN